MKYRHYKGGIYEVLHEGVNTETRELVVIYKDSIGNVWVRQYDMFHEHLTDGRKRFELIKD